MPGDNNIIDPLVVVSHDIKIGNHNHLLEKVRIGNTNLIGANSTILPKLEIGDNNIM